MENASKALIIAGAILISIVLVSVGVIVVNSLNPEDALQEMDRQAVETFNSKFTSLAGSNVRGTVVKQIINNVITSNGNNEDNKQISIVLDSNVSVSGVTASGDGTSASSDLSRISNSINTQHRYTVELYYTKNGLVNKITIKDNNA